MGRFYRWLVSGTCLDRSLTVQFCEPWSVHTVQTVALFQALKRCRSISSPPYTASFGAYSLNKFNPENKKSLSITLKPSPHSLNHSLPLPYSLNHSFISASLLRHRHSTAQISFSPFQSLSHLCLSPSSSSQLSTDRNSLSQHSLPLSLVAIHLCCLYVGCSHYNKKCLLQKKKIVAIISKSLQ